MRSARRGEEEQDTGRRDDVRPDEDDGDGPLQESDGERDKRIRKRLGAFVGDFTLRLWDRNDDGKLSFKEKRRRAVWRLVLVAVAVVVVVICTAGIAAPVAVPAGTSVAAASGATVGGVTTSAAAASWVSANAGVICSTLAAVLPLMGQLSGHKATESDKRSIGEVFAVVAQILEVTGKAKGGAA